MKLFITLSLITLLGTAFAAADEKSQSLRTSTRSVEDLREAVAAAGGCKAHVCFAIDGSGSVSERDFTRMGLFAMDVLNVIAGKPVKAAACQYGLTASPISFLTNDVEQFFKDISDATLDASSATSLAAGIVWCSGQLDTDDTQPRKIVILGDGMNNFGASATSRANLFRATGGEICAVAVRASRSSRRRLMRIVGGDPDRFLRLRDFIELGNILEDLVEEICDIDLP